MKFLRCVLWDVLFAGSVFICKVLACVIVAVVSIVCGILIITNPVFLDARSTHNTIWYLGNEYVRVDSITDECYDARNQTIKLEEVCK